MEVVKTTDRWGSIPRSYIIAERDRAIDPRLQQLFIEQADAQFPNNLTTVYRLDSDHSPFFTATNALTDTLFEIAGRRLI
jgi:hypothetical protein